LRYLFPVPEFTHIEQILTAYDEHLIDDNYGFRFGEIEWDEWEDKIVRHNFGENIDSFEDENAVHILPQNPQLEEKNEPTLGGCEREIKIEQNLPQNLFYKKTNFSPVPIPAIPQKTLLEIRQTTPNSAYLPEFMTESYMTKLPHTFLSLAMLYMSPSLQHNFHILTKPPLTPARPTLPLSNNSSTQSNNPINKNPQSSDIWTPLPWLFNSFGIATHITTSNPPGLIWYLLYYAPLHQPQDDDFIDLINRCRVDIVNKFAQTVPMFLVIRQASIYLLSAALKLHPNPNQQDSYNRTALHYMSMTGYWYKCIFDQFIHENVNVFYQNLSDFFYALFFKHGFLTNIVDSSLQSPLSHAIMTDSPGEIIKMLMDFTVSYSASQKENNGAIYLQRIVSDNYNRYTYGYNIRPAQSVEDITMTYLGIYHRDVVGNGGESGWEKFGQKLNKKNYFFDLYQLRSIFESQYSIPIEPDWTDCESMLLFEPSRTPQQQLQRQYALGVFYLFKKAVFTNILKIELKLKKLKTIVAKSEQSSFDEEQNVILKEDCNFEDDVRVYSALVEDRLSKLLKGPQNDVLDQLDRVIAAKKLSSNDEQNDDEQNADEQNDDAQNETPHIFITKNYSNPIFSSIPPNINTKQILRTTEERKIPAPPPPIHIDPSFYTITDSKNDPNSSQNDPSNPPNSSHTLHVFSPPAPSNSLLGFQRGNAFTNVHLLTRRQYHNNYIIPHFHSSLHRDTYQALFPPIPTTILQTDYTNRFNQLASHMHPVRLLSMFDILLYQTCLHLSTAGKSGSLKHHLVLGYPENQWFPRHDSLVLAKKRPNFVKNMTDNTENDAVNDGGGFKRQSNRVISSPINTKLTKQELKTIASIAPFPPSNPDDFIPFYREPGYNELLKSASNEVIKKGINQVRFDVWVHFFATILLSYRLFIFKDQLSILNTAYKVRNGCSVTDGGNIEDNDMQLFEKSLNLGEKYTSGLPKECRYSENPIYQTLSLYLEEMVLKKGPIENHPSFQQNEYLSTEQSPHERHIWYRDDGFNTLNNEDKNAKNAKNAKIEHNSNQIGPEENVEIEMNRIMDITRRKYANLASYTVEIECYINIPKEELFFGNKRKVNKDPDSSRVPPSLIGLNRQYDRVNDILDKIWGQDMFSVEDTMRIKKNKNEKNNKKEQKNDVKKKSYSDWNTAHLRIRNNTDIKNELYYNEDDIWYELLNYFLPSTTCDRCNAIDSPLMNLFFNPTGQRTESSGGFRPIPTGSEELNPFLVSFKNYLKSPNFPQKEYSPGELSGNNDVNGITKNGTELTTQLTVGKVNWAIFSIFYSALVPAAELALKWFGEYLKLYYETISERGM
jgi:hypothetical protein